MLCPIPFTFRRLLVCFVGGILLACSGNKTDGPASSYDDSSNTGNNASTNGGNTNSHSDGDGDSEETEMLRGSETNSSANQSNCAAMGACGADATQACCTKVRLDGGDFLMGAGHDSDACPIEMACGEHESPEHEASVSPFSLNMFEVTVGRFRHFVENFEQQTFLAGDGSHPLINASGIDSTFASMLPSDEASLRSSLLCSARATFTEEPSENENKPINCVTWYLAMAFCIFDGGRLPTEAEWEFAAAGGSENRLYAWGNGAPTTDRASYFPGLLADVGSFPQGNALSGLSDLSGNVWEWVLDWFDTNWYQNDGATCVDCARVSSGSHRTIRGGAFSYEAIALRSAARSGEVPEARNDAVGFRCAYDQ